APGRVPPRLRLRRDGVLYTTGSAGTTGPPPLSTGCTRRPPRPFRTAALATVHLTVLLRGRLEGSRRTTRRAARRPRLGARIHLACPSAGRRPRSCELSARRQQSRRRACADGRRRLRGNLSRLPRRKNAGAARGGFARVDRAITAAAQKSGRVAAPR